MAEIVIGKLLEELGGVAEMAGVAGVAGLAREADEAGCLPILAGPAEIDPVPQVAELAETIDVSKLRI